ncbi:thrombospondin type 3 repeat-containing protein, partial [Urechidicola sp. P050]
MSSPEFCEDNLPNINTLSSFATANNGISTYFFNAEGLVNVNGVNAVADQGPILPGVYNFWALTVNVNNCYTVSPFTVKINGLPEVSITPVDAVCSTDAPFQLVGSPQGGTWSGNGVDANGMFDPSVAGEGDVEIMYDVTNIEGCTASDMITISVESCIDYCSYTQGFYGNEGGLGCAPLEEERVDAEFMMNQALCNVGGTQVFGSMDAGSGYFTIIKADATNGNLFKWLPGGGKPRALKPGINTYNGKFNNVLLSQTVTLFFNIELNGALALWKLDNEFYTSAAKGCGTGESYFKTETFTMPMSVINQLGGMGVATVEDLFELANDALAGKDIGITSHAAINEAIDAINRGFDECRVERSEPNSDEDSHPDSTDNCIEIPNEDQSDIDGDGIGDVCDSCPND